MMLPEKVKISGIDYIVDVAEHQEVEEGMLMGQIIYHEGRIYLNEVLNDQLKESTLLHEIVHGILYHMGSEMNDNEEFVEGFSSGLYQVFRDNGWKFKEGE